MYNIFNVVLYTTHTYNSSPLSISVTTNQVLH